MNPKLRIALFLYSINIVFLIGAGLVFQFSNSFLPFHSDVIQTKWAQVDLQSQILYLGMMRTEAAGFLASGAAITFLLLIPFRRSELWACWAMTIVGIIEYLPTLLANYHVSTVSEASPPWPLMLSLIVSLVLALWFGLAGILNLDSRHSWES